VISIDKLPVRYRGRRNSPLHKPIEEHSSLSGRTAVEPEGVLVKIVVQMLVADSALMNAKQPAFQERRNPVRAWHCYMRRIPSAEKTMTWRDYLLMPSQWIVAAEAPHARNTRSPAVSGA